MSGQLAVSKSTHKHTDDLSRKTDIIYKRPGVMRFQQRDISEYDWTETPYFYGRGHYLGSLAYLGRRTHPKVPILFTDDRVWSVPCYRHYKRLREFFIPGIAQGVPMGYIMGYDFYPLLPEEKEEAERIVHREFDLKILEEAEALREVYSNYVGSLPKTKQLPGQLIFLFGPELFRGEEPEQFRERMSKSSRRPSVKIYV
jgi:hypothetical protein